MIPFLTESQLMRQLNEINFRPKPLFFTALEQAKKSHINQKRDDGRPYLEEHIYPVVLDLAAHFPDNEKLLASALLHDVLEDDDSVSGEYFINNFGKDIFDIVKPITKSKSENGDLPENKKREINERIVKKLENAPTESKLIKLADRANNLESSVAIKKTRKAKYDRYLKETKEIFLPFAEKESGYFYNKIINIVSNLENN